MAGMKKIIRKIILLLSFFFVNNFVCSAAGMEVVKNVNSVLFPQSLILNQNIQPLDKGYIDITKPPYNAFGDGLSDDTKAIQQAIDDAYNCNLIVFFPANKIFLVSQQLKCITAKISRKFAHQLIGSTKGIKPIIKLKDGSFVDRNILVLFELTDKNGNSNPPSLYGATFRGINIDMGNNPPVNGISMAGAQHCVIENVKIYGTNFNAGVFNLPGSGGGVVDLTVIGGKIGVVQYVYRPNPTLTGLKLENQSEYGVKVTESRGPVIITGFKIISPVIPSDQYRAIYINNVKSSEENGHIDHGHANLCLTDGTIEVNGVTGKAIFNYAQDVTINNVYFKASEVIESGVANPPSKIVKGNPIQWQRIENYVFTSQLDKSSVYVDGKEMNDRTANFQLFDQLIEQQPNIDYIAMHTWERLPSWEDNNIVDIVSDFGATSENVNDTDDDGLAIQKAICAVTTLGNPDFGKTVFIPRGHFYISKPLILKSGLKMIGAGKFISVIQASKEWKNKLGAVLESENKNGNLLLSDFAVLGYSRMSFMHIRTANTLIRDVVTEIIRPKYKAYQYLNPSEVPYVAFSGYAGGKIYNLCTDHIPILDKLEKDIRYKNYNLLSLQNTKKPLTFYQLSIEHLKNSPQMLIANSQCVTFYGLKYEMTHELINIENSHDIKIIGGSGNYLLNDPKDIAIIVIKNSKDIQIQNLNRKSTEKAFKEDLIDVCKYWIVNELDKVPGDFGVLFYKR